MKKKNPYIDLIKFGILFHTLLTVAIGYYLARIGQPFYPIFFVFSLIGIGLISSGAAAWNHAMEHREDALMDRTKSRPIPSGLFTVRYVFVFGATLIFLGSLLLTYLSLFDVLFLSLGIVVLYNFVYTPLKKVTWLNTFVGAFPGALPPVCGWLAGGGAFNVEIWMLFLVFYFWQFPHFFSIAWKYRDAYRAAGFKMISEYDQTGARTGFWTLLTCFILLVVSFIPLFSSVYGMIYGVTALLIGTVFFWSCYRFYLSPTDLNATVVLRISLFYPLFIMVALFFDRFN